MLYSSGFTYESVYLFLTVDGHDCALVSKEGVFSMKKCIAFLVVLILILSLAACSEEAVLDETKVYQVESDIHSLEIQVSAADLVIKAADDFSVESNLKFLTVSEGDGTLKIHEDVKFGVTYSNAQLTLYVPAGTVFESASITTGAAKLTAGALSAKTLKLQLGAGDVNIDILNALTEADITGGAGKITIGGGTFTDLNLKMGVGSLNMTAFLAGNSDLTLGVGTSNLTLLGSLDDYTIDIEKGLGSIIVNGETVSEFDNEGVGPNDVEIEGGVGAIYLIINEDAQS